MLSGGAAVAAFPASIARALAIPANHRTGTLEDVEHIVIMMQENRSFDHYFGTLRGVRGFGDPRAVELADGSSVFSQLAGDKRVMPFHPEAPDLGLVFLEDLPHDWATTQKAWNGGRYDQWVPQKGTTTMAHLTRSDIPYHYALADAFTVCDAYHCSLLGPTDPNRYYMWTGWVGNDGAGGGPVVDNAEAGYGWMTYPERLEAAGVSWKIYQDVGAGLTAANGWGDGKDPYIGNYGDNALLYFKQYREAQPGSALYEKAKTGTNISNGGGLFDHFKRDVKAGTLPSVSWVVAPEAYTEHPNWPANYGAWYVSQVLDALTENPEVWSKTVFLLTYDENDGFFDHVVPPTVPVSKEHGISTVETTNEIFAGTAKLQTGPYGMGMRVPMIVISPWSKGGYVDSRLMDHTAMIRLIEKRFGVAEPNLTPWRRAVGGDLTSALNFATPNDARVTLPGTTAYAPPDRNKHPDYKPVPPEKGEIPKQEAGTRPARALPYELEVEGKMTDTGLTLRFRNTGKAAAVFQVRSQQTVEGETSSQAPWTYTVGGGEELTDTLTDPLAAEMKVSVHGPNGFLRTFKGLRAQQAKLPLEVSNGFDAKRQTFTVRVRNTGSTSCPVTLLEGYTKQSVSEMVKAGAEWEKTWPLASSSGWYDVAVTSAGSPAFERRFAGHLEDGRESRTDPLIGVTA